MGGEGYDFWKPYERLKIINFSRSLHKKLLSWGFDSMYIQYFPNPAAFIGGRSDEIFFWQRLDNITINTIAELIDEDGMKIHIHKAVDPNHQFCRPTSDQEAQYQITYSDWFETKDEMLNIIKSKGIYVAPREYEGIGMSFLEAMAMGKAVIAPDNPTMNEYITHNKTGYLYNLSKLRPIELSDISKVQRNAYEYVCKGYAHWEENKHRIIEFIESE